ncbi:hypothetical protein ABIB73_002419 [Bradyrhizobium sp. F1.4.3]
MTLLDRVRVAPRFQRAIRIDTDVDDPRALEGFLCPQSAVETLLTMARHVAETGHSAFTWTGPYGSGKSSLVVALNAVLGGDAKRRARAAEIVGKKSSEQLWKSMPPQSKGWRMLPIVGRRGPPVEAVGEGLAAAGLCRRPRGEWTEAKVLETLSQAAKEQPRTHGGLILVLDEMGKFLEGAVGENTDIFFFQQVAELATRSSGRLVVIGILHQAFEEYAQRLSREQRDEWSKVQGRYVDLLVDTAGEEQLELLARAIQVDGARPDRSKSIKAVADSIANSRRGDAGKIGATLAKCLPLHPIVAALLGPISRRRFGQNQRSVFGFLNSAEPYGFQEFLRTSDDGETYDAPRLWNYLRSNLEPSILASPDGHRWSSAVEVVERCEATQGERLHVDMVKAIAVTELFRERSGIAATKALLSNCIPGTSEADVRAALDDLAMRSLIVFRKHLSAYGVYAGSDFDIEAALEKAMSEQLQPDFASLRSLASFQPVVAKRHYHETGSLRWFDLDVLPASELKSRVERYKVGKGAMGLLLLPIPTANETVEEVLATAREALSSDRDILIGVSPNAAMVLDAAKEALALERIGEERPELHGDPVAKREVMARLSSAQNQLENVLRLVLDSASWVRRGVANKALTAADLSSLASNLADTRYGAAPKLFNELLIRVSPSSNANTAKNVLLKAMVASEGIERLGMTGLPAEAGLFISLLEKTELYRRVGRKWKYVIPGTDDVDPAGLAPLWNATDDFLRKHSKRVVPLNEIFNFWRDPPFGIKDGVHAVLGLAYALSRRDHLAYYRQEVFQPQWTDYDADLLINDPGDIQVRWLEISASGRKLLEGVRDVLAEFDEAEAALSNSPLDVARALVATFEALEPWTKRTVRLDAEVLSTRDILRHASDPNTLLFDDLPKLFMGDDGTTDSKRVREAVARIGSTVRVLKSRYRSMLDELLALMLRELDMDGVSDPAAVLRDRAENVQQISGDFDLDAFVLRLSRPLDDKVDIESIASLAAHKPAKDWSDADLDRARVEIVAFAQRFVRLEALAIVNGRKPKRHAMAVVVGMGDRRDARSHEFAISDHDAQAVRDVIATVEQAMKSASKQRKNVILAALAEISSRYMDEPSDRPTAAPKVGAKA